MANELNVKLLGDASDLQNALSLAANALKELEKQVKNATDPIDDLEKKAKKSGQALKDMAKQAADVGKTMSMYVTAPLVAAGGFAIKMAADFNESLNKVDVAFKSSAQEVKDFAKTTLESFGIAEGTALDMASTFGDMATSMGLSTQEASKLSTQLVGLAGDLSSMKNVSVDVAQTALNGIFTGETESLKRLGIVMTEANVKTYALSQGMKINYETMTQAEKVLLRYNYVMSVTKNSQGDFARTSESAANQMRKFGQGVQQLGQEFGQVMLPAVTSIVSVLNDVIKSISGAGDSTKSFIVTLGGLAAATGPLLFLAGTIIPKVIEGIRLMEIAVKRFNLTLKSAGGIMALASLLGVAASSAYDYAKALKPDNKLSDQEKTDANAIREKNKQIYASIELLKKQKSAAKAPVTGMNAAQGVSAGAIDAQIAQQVKQLQENRALLAKLDKDAKAASGGNNANLGLGAISEDGGKAKKLSDDVLGIRNSMISLNKEVDKSKIELMDLFKFFNAMKLGGIQDSLKNVSFQGFEGLAGKVKSPLAVMDAAITTSVQTQQAQLDLLAEKYNSIMTLGQMVADQTGQAFTSLGDSIIQSMGLASTGFEGFAQVMLQTLVKLGSMIVQQIVMNQASAMSSAIAGATQSGAATGPAAIFTTPAFIATAIGGVLSAFAAIPKFAAGGIVSGPTMGLMGEYPGAKSNPEVIAPLSKLQGMLDQGNGGGGGPMTGEFVLRGQDLVVALQRAEKQRNRIG